MLRSAARDNGLHDGALTDVGEFLAMMRESLVMQRERYVESMDLFQADRSHLRTLLWNKGYRHQQLDDAVHTRTSRARGLLERQQERIQQLAGYVEEQTKYLSAFRH